MQHLRQVRSKPAHLLASDDGDQKVHVGPSPVLGISPGPPRDILTCMRIHLQRKLVVSLEQGQVEIVRLDLSPFAQASDVQVVIIPNEQGLWLTIVQETGQSLDEVPILPGFHRTSPA